MLSDVFYTLQKLQRTLAHLLFPLSSIYTPFLRGFMHAHQNILVFPALFEGSQSDPTVWGERGPGGVWCWGSPFPVGAGRLCCSDGFICGSSQDVLGWIRAGVCLAVPGVTKTLAGAKSPHVSAHEAGSGGDWGAAPYRHQFTPSSSGVHRAEKNPTRAGCQPQWLSMGLHFNFCDNK